MDQRSVECSRTLDARAWPWVECPSCKVALLVSETRTEDRASVASASRHLQTSTAFTSPPLFSLERAGEVGARPVGRQRL